MVAMPKRKGPDNIEIRTYQVGFGDCFMVTFKYADRTRLSYQQSGFFPGLPNCGPNQCPRTATGAMAHKLRQNVRTDGMRRPLRIVGAVDPAAGKNIDAGHEPGVETTPAEQDFRVRSRSAQQYDARSVVRSHRPFQPPRRLSI